MPHGRAGAWECPEGFIGSLPRGIALFTQSQPELHRAKPEFPPGKAVSGPARPELRGRKLKSGGVQPVLLGGKLGVRGEKLQFRSSGG